MSQSELSRRLISAREKKGLSLYDAAKLMENTSYQTLWHLEGKSKGRKPAKGPEIKVKTAFDIVETYWPEIKIKDLMPSVTMIAFTKLDDPS